MSIDYDRLRELADEHTPGPWLCERDGDEYEFVIGTEDFGIITEADNEVDGQLIALAPDMARELLRLRRELTDLRDEYARIATVCNCTDDPVGKTQAGTLQSASMRLSEILDGDTE